MAWIRRLVLFLSLVPVYFVGEGVAAPTSMSFIKDIASAAAIVFAVLGAWIALIYPDAARALQQNKGATGSQTLRAKRLIDGLVQCSVVVTVAIFAPFFVEIFKSDFNGAAIKGLLLTLSYLCGLSVSSALWSSIFIGDISFVDMINAKRRREAMDAPFKGRTRSRASQRFQGEDDKEERGDN